MCSLSLWLFFVRVHVMFNPGGYFYLGLFYADVGHESVLRGVHFGPHVALNARKQKTL